MFCNRCGAKLPEGARFCHNCGSAAYSGEDSAHTRENQRENSARDFQAKPMPEKQPRSKAVLAVCLGIAAILVVVILVGLLIKKPAETTDAVIPPSAPLAGQDEVSSAPEEGTQTNQNAPESADLNETVDAILSGMESLEGFVEADEFYQPLASLTDIDGNGVYELLLLYKKNDSGMIDVKYTVWSIDGEDFSALRTDTLYSEVGGNSGWIVPVVDKEGKPYLLAVSREPQGDRFNNTYVYIPWNEDQSELTDEWVYMESHGIYGEADKGSYILGDKSVDKEDFDRRQASFTNYWSELNLNNAPTEDSGIMSFAQMRETDLNDIEFYSR